jgi:integrase
VRKKPAPTLLACWLAYVAAQESTWRGAKTKDGWLRSINSHAAAIKHLPVDEIGVDEVMKVIEPLWTTKAESAGKLRDRLERVLDYARVKKYRSGENPAVWKGNLFHLLPPRPKLQRGHMRALPYQHIPELMRSLAAKEGMAARALEFTILTIARETMTVEATWAEVHGDLWALEAERMKKRPFRQPLSTGALSVLNAVRPAHPRSNQLLFPSPKVGRVLSNSAMDKVLADLGADATPHGMRSSFRDWAGDETEFARETIEECMAHLVGDETERAYRRSDALKKRRAVLEAWSAYCIGRS